MATNRTIDVLAVGNAIVDVIAHADDAFLSKHGLHKGSMQLIDAKRATVLYDAMGPGTEMSGGSAANTAVGVAALGGTAAFIGRVAADQLGEVFTHDIRAAGVGFDVPPATSGQPTARSMVLVSPDGQRTMNTFLGAAAELSPSDIHDDVADAEVTFLEGYLFDPPEARAALKAAASAAQAAGRRVAFTCSDAFLVGRHHVEQWAFIREQVDVLFANESEAMALAGNGAPDSVTWDATIDVLRDAAEIVVVTRSEKGSLVLAAGGEIEVPADRAEVVDTTGAGDSYAAGFLYGLTHGYELGRCAQLGSRCAAEVISHIGGRPQVDLRELCADLLD